MKTYNINSTVKVKLTDYGKKLHKQTWSSILAGTDIKLPKLIEDDAGYSEWQLWELMAFFGNNLYLGNQHLPFETDILIDENNLAS